MLEILLFPVQFLNSLWVLWTQNYWRDEVFRIFMSQRSLTEIVILTYGDGQPPLFYYLLKIWMWIFGDGEVVTRAFSLIAFEILIFLLLYFSRNLKPKTTLFSISVLLLTFFNPSLLYYAFETRMYLFFILTVFLTNYFLYLKKYSLWVIFSLVGLYTHNFMVFILLANLIWLFTQREISKKVKKAIFLITIFYLPWIGVFWHQANLIIQDFWVENFSLPLFLSSVASVYFGYENTPIIYHRLFMVLSAVIVAIMVFSPKDKLWKFNMISFWTPLLAVVIISIFLRPVFLARYLSFLTIPLILLISSFIAVLPKRTGWVFLAFSVVVSLYVFQILFPVRIKADIRSRVIDVIGLIKEGDEIYTSPLNYFETQYYFAKLAPIDYTKTIPIKVFYPFKVPFYVGKVLIKNEAITNQIPTDKRIFAIGQDNKITIFSRF